MKYFTLTLFIVGVVAFAAQWFFMEQNPVELKEQPLQQDTTMPPKEAQATQLPAATPTTSPVTTQSKPLIGGAFTLTNQYGKTVDESQFRGKVMLVYFGFSMCPDICPVDLARITQVANQVDSDQLVPIFITLDPERDTVEVLKAYAEHYHPSLQALTGDKTAINQAVATYRVSVIRVEDSMVDEYNFSHSGHIYLMDQQGNYIKHFGKSASIQAMVSAVNALINKS